MDLHLSRLHSSALSDTERLVAFLNKTGTAAAAAAVAAAAAAVAAAAAAVAAAAAAVAAAAAAAVALAVAIAAFLPRSAPPAAAAAAACGVPAAANAAAAAAAAAHAAAAAAAAAEGRDKATKALQYGCRLLAWASSNSKISEKFASLYRASADSRKLFRLGKFVNEYLLLLKLAAAKTPDSDTNRKIQLLQALCRAAFFCYWVTDNAFILSKLRVLSRDSQKLARLSGLFWLVALLAGVYCEVLRLRAAAAAAAAAAANKDADSSEGSSSKEAAAANLQLQSTRRTIQLNLLKQCCDLPAAANMAGLTALLLRRNFSDGFVGATGLLSALISCHQLY
ncbi:peroxisomal biogenesis factor 11 domain-containing protein, putative [Eimeria necatrix]|uniref:Peroxisomal biogenesis factor 11 domain-containing protein, putative n=1 Tax=Eimeria necatrix TaxID=51315 RepID=U6MLC2_9EIME|nr:peroxisomal biogenesis factor 11 domain-containing protein, putative [Eimeria necatrix]CDJ64811.1 peroxisomal biogenesis factor 11 domain-containing protein, putative [Eimeria necatrix]